MSTRTAVELLDDLDLAAGKETPADATLRLALDGRAVEIELTNKHRDKLAALLAPYLDAGRPVTASAPGRRSANGAPRTGGRDKAQRRRENDAIRAFADAQGIPYPARGRLPGDLRQRFADAGSPGA